MLVFAYTFAIPSQLHLHKLLLQMLQRDYTGIKAKGTRQVKSFSLHSSPCPSAPRCLTGCSRPIAAHQGHRMRCDGTQNTAELDQCCRGAAKHTPNTTTNQLGPQGSEPPLPHQPFGGQFAFWGAEPDISSKHPGLW